MPEQLLTILKLCLLALLYLFFLRVVRAVWVEVNGPRLRSPQPTPETTDPEPRKSAKATAKATAKARKSAKGPVLVVVAPAEQQGQTYPLGEEITVGRAAGCQVTLEDSYVSQIHARVFAREGQIYVEDLGSTNGTYLNRRKVAGPMLVSRGDRVQVGSTVMELVLTVLAGGAWSDVGRVRSVNQDGALSSSFLFAVADGMGGHRGGEVASALALRALGGRLRYASADDLVAAVQQANEVVHRSSLEDRDLRGMGTTLCAIALVGPPDAVGDVEAEQLVLVNVGDSRAYRLDEEGHLDQLTVDHSLVQLMVDDGQITPEEAEHHPQRNIVTRVLGVEAAVDVDVWELDIVAGDRFLVCSDGLFGEVEAGRIAAELRRWADPRDAARQLVDLANAAGGRDNITCAVFDVREDDDEVSAEAEQAAGEVDATGTAVDLGTAAEDGDRPGATGPLDPGDAGSRRSGAAPAPGGGPTALQTAVAHRRSRAPGTAASPEMSGTAGQLGPGRVTAPRATGGRARRVTGRAVLFVLAVLAVLGLAALAVGWYATRTYFVGTDGTSVVIYRGRPGGMLWIDPTVAEQSDLQVALLPPQGCDIVAGEPSTTDIEDARAIVDRLRADIASRPANAARCEPS